MKKTLKILGILAAALVVLVIVGVVIVFVSLNSIAKKGIESGGTYALGVTTKVDSVSIHPFAGEVSLSGLDVANPQGFTSPHFLAMGKGDVAVTLASLNQDVVEVPKIALSGIDVSLEKSSAGSNYQKILDNLAKLKGSGSKPAPTPSGGPEKKFVIRDLTIDNINIHADLIAVPGDLGKIVSPVTKVNVPIDHIQLKDVGKTGSGVGGTGVTMQELTSIIVQAVLAAAADKGGGIIPADILGDLKGGLSSLGGLAGIPVSVVGKAGEAVTQVGSKAAEEVQKGLEGAADKIGQGIGDLLGGNKDKKNPPKKP